MTINPLCRFGLCEVLSCQTSAQQRVIHVCVASNLQLCIFMGHVYMLLVLATDINPRYVTTCDSNEWRQIVRLCKHLFSIGKALQVQPCAPAVQKFLLVCHHACGAASQSSSAKTCLHYGLRVKGHFSLPFLTFSSLYSEIHRRRRRSHCNDWVQCCKNTKIGSLKMLHKTAVQQLLQHSVCFVQVWFPCGYIPKSQDASCVYRQLLVT